MSALVLTENGVEEAVILNREQLYSLAKWLCQENEHCDHQPSYFEDKRTKEQRDNAYDQHEEQVKSNGGYCDECLNFAGELLAAFDIKERRV